MSTQIQFELASPNKMYFGKPVAMVSVPGGEGRYCVLAGHAPMATTLGAGLVEIYESESSTVSARFFVTGGFCQVTNGQCTLLADAVIPQADLKPEAIESEMKALYEKAHASETEEERLKIEGELVITRAKLAAVAV